MAQPTTLTERITDWHLCVAVDRVRRIIQNVALAGLQSKNGYSYTSESLRQAVALYENKPVFLDHPPDVNRPNERSTRDLAGSITNVRFEDQRVRGDIRVLNTESGQTLLALAEADTPGIGLSHVVLAERSGDGKTVERIHDVISVDAVINPATTRTFREADRAPAPTAPAATPSGEAATPLSSAEDLDLLRSELASLTSERQRLDERLTSLSAQLGELRDELHVHCLLETASLPAGMVSEQFRDQLKQLPDDESRRRLIFARTSAFRDGISFLPRSSERSSGHSSSPPDSHFIAAIRHRGI